MKERLFASSYLARLGARVWVFFPHDDLTADIVCLLPEVNV